MQSDVVSVIDFSLGDAIVLPIVGDNAGETITAQDNVIEVVSEIVQEVVAEEVEDDEAYPKPRTSKPERWKKHQAKRLKDAGKVHVSVRGKHRKEKMLQAGCSHKCKRKCHNNFNEVERKEILKKFWALEDHSRQWCYISSHVRAEKVMRRTVHLLHSEAPRRKFSYTYFLPMDGRLEQVCQKFFLGTLDISERWVRTAMTKIIQNHGAIPKDNRGKIKKPSVASINMRNDVINHIKSFATVEGHYTRKNSKSRYLPETLNRRIMHSMYKIMKQGQSATKIASLRQYRDIFKKEFNLKFFRPKKDQCNTCLSWKHKRPHERTPEAARRYEKHIEDKKISQDLKAADIDLIKNSPELQKTLCVLSCDLEKVLMCPKSENGEFFYRSRLSVFNFTIFVSGDQEGFCYTWDQTIARKGSAEISSCLLLFIKAKIEKGIKEFHIYSDNCSAQNKNQFLFSLYVMLSIRYNIKIVHTYLEVGHTHMEVDSVHATIEKSVKNVEIFLPSQWVAAMKVAKKNRPHYNVIEITQEDVFNYKPLADHQRWTSLRTSFFKQIVVDGAKPGIIQFKNEFNEELQEASIFKKSPGRPVNWETIQLRKMYSARIPLRPIELKHIRELCEKDAIPTLYHEYYLEFLPSIGNYEVPAPPVLSDIESGLSDEGADDSSDDSDEEEDADGEETENEDQQSDSEASVYDSREDD